MAAFLPHAALPLHPVPPSAPSCVSPPTCGLPSLQTASNALLVFATSALLTVPIPTNGLPIPKLPPIDRANTNRCRPSSSAIGQANAARDKLLDLRECDLRNVDLSKFDLSGGIFSNANLRGAQLTDAQLSKSYVANADLRGVDFSNAVADRVVFDFSDLTGAVFVNAVLSDSTFEGAVLENVDFTDVYIGDFAQRSICRNDTLRGTNPKTGASTRESLGCRK